VIASTDGQRALELACEMGLERARGGSVLLAPLGASFDQFRDYKDRGAAFRAAVARLAQAVGRAPS
jgi:UDP-N-acetylmuramoylalanine--D-glutamate ligase